MSRIHGSGRRLWRYHSIGVLPSVPGRAWANGIGSQSYVVVHCLFSYPRIVCTAPTMQQLDNVLWAEMAKWLDASPVLQMMFTWTKTRVYMNGYDRRWFAVPRTATKPESLQGFHEDNMLSWWTKHPALLTPSLMPSAAL